MTGPLTKLCIQALKQEFRRISAIGLQQHVYGSQA